MSEPESPQTEPQDRQAMLKRATTLKQQIEDCLAAGNEQQAGIYRTDLTMLLRQFSPEEAILIGGALFGDTSQLL